MDGKHSWVYFGVLAIILISGLLAITLVGASRGQAQPAPVPGKLDAVLGALLSTTAQGSEVLSSDGELDLETIRRDDQSSPFHISSDGQTQVDVLIEDRRFSGRIRRAGCHDLRFCRRHHGRARTHWVRGRAFLLG